jgi:outer membrane protein assembly factor BamB
MSPPRANETSTVHRRFAHVRALRAAAREVFVPESSRRVRGSRVFCAGTAALALFVLAGTLAAQAQTGVTLSPTSGSPTAVVAVSGTSFGDLEAVDVYVDQVDTALLVSSSTGKISGSVTIPATASPGNHYITAIGRKTGDAAQTTFDVSTPWNELGFGAARLGANPWENTLSTATVSAIGPKWIKAAGTEGATGATIAVHLNDLYVSTYAGIEELSTTSGSVLWSFPAAGVVFASPTVYGATVYVGSESNGTFYALNKTTGALIWSKALGCNIYSSATVANGVVYTACYGGTVFALNASTGSTLWVYTVSGGSIIGSPAVVNGVVYFGSTNYSAYALNAATGGRIWSYATLGEIECTPAVANGVVYVGSQDGYVYALGTSPTSPGVLLWSSYIQGSVYYSPAVANGTVYVASEDGTFYALDAHTGSTKWKLPTGTALRGAAVANGVVYLTAGDTLIAVDATSGSILASADTGPTYLGSPSISDGVVYVAAQGGNLYALSLPPNLNTNARLSGPPLPASLHPDLRLSAERPL